ncbi:putative RNA-directed DNA polymerase [Helianthus annuus]|nr:putative RNA-directed DNA polymerase [Helianthus annuus]
MEFRDLNEDEEWIKSECIKNLGIFGLNKANDLKQRSRVRWAIDGDDNSAFFHGVINRRKASNFIHGLSVDGKWTQEPNKIKKEILSFFRNLYVEKRVVRPLVRCHGIKRISQEDANVISGPFSDKEIKEAVFACGSDRAPGPDGVNFRFIKKFWHLFEHDFGEIMRHFFQFGAFNQGSGSSFITLIPKSKDPTTLRDYRPINLIGVISKTVSKITATRFKKVIGKVISSTQSAFVKDRFILDSPLMLNEVMAWLKQRKKKALLLKIDFEKAYDNVNWKFIIDILDQMGFPAKWRMWMEGILSSARSAVLVNGSPTFEFQCQKGLRQGDPISPFLFLVVMEILSCLISNACNLGCFKGINTPNGGPVMSHFLYADDALILGEWSVENIKTIARILRIFHICSGLKINFHKSNIFGLGVTEEELESMASILGCKTGSFPFKYLGISVGANMNRIYNWNPVVDIFQKRLSSWKAQSFSIGGRITLIKAVLESLPIYYFSLFKAPVKVVNKLESLMRRFLWAGKEEVKKMHWVSWDRVALPKKLGGLGLCKLNYINISLLTKWIWRFKAEEDSLWKLVIKAIHGKERKWAFLPLNSAVSGVWKTLVKIVEGTVIKGKGLNVLIKGHPGTGRHIKFWSDFWIGDRPLMFLWPNLYNKEADILCSIADRLAVVGNQPVYAWNWSGHSLSVSERADLIELELFLREVRLSNQFDKWCWSDAKDGLFHTAVVRKSLVEEKAVSYDFIMEWVSWVPAKCGVFFWRALQDKIPTRSALVKRNINIPDPYCCFCGDYEESTDHLFTGCSLAVRVWALFCGWARLPPLFAFSFRDLAEFHKVCNLNKEEKTVVKGLIIIGSWCIWKERNDKIFSNSGGRSEDIMRNIKSLGFLWLKNRSKFKDIVWVEWCIFPMYML